MYLNYSNDVFFWLCVLFFMFDWLQCFHNTMLDVQSPVVLPSGGKILQHREREVFYMWGLFGVNRGKNLGFAKSKYPATWTKTGAPQRKSHGAATHRVIDGWTLWNAAQKEGGNRAKGKSVFTSGGLLMTRVIAWSGRGRPSRGNVPVQVQLLHWDLQLLRFMGRSTGNDVGWKKCM